MSVRRYVFPTVILVLQACGSTPQVSRLQVTNGAQDQDGHPAAVLLVMDNRLICSGSFLDDQTVLTAAHCLENIQSMSIMTPETEGRPEQTVATAIKWVKHPDYHQLEDLHADLGLVSFPQGTSAHFYSLTQSSPQPGDIVNVVGFGHNEIQRNSFDYVIQEKGAGQKRVGSNQISSVQAGTMTFSGHISSAEALKSGEPIGQKVGMGGGDSGGPLLNARGELVGVASSQYIHWDGMPRIRSIDSIYVDLTTASSRTFLDR